MRKNIALLAGGYTGEYEISVKTAHTIEKNLDKELWNVYKIIIDKGAWIYKAEDGSNYEVNKNDFTIDINRHTIVFDAVFNAIHGTPGEDGKIQGYLEMLEVPCTGCNSIVSAITFNKIYCNSIISKSKVVNVSKSLHVIKTRQADVNTLLSQVKLPVFVKPAEGGSSLATTKVKYAEDLQLALNEVYKMDNQAMIEEYVKGREFSIGVYRTMGVVRALPITEIISTKEFFDYEAKYTPGITNEVTPAQVSDEISNKISNTAIKIYEILNCAGVCRVDFILEDNSNELYFLEINTIPGQSENSIVPQQVRAAGYTLSDFYTSLLKEII